MDDLLDRVRQGNTRALARLISDVENDESLAQDAVAALYSETGSAYIVGVTGPPGCGKSSLVNELAKTLNENGNRVAIVAVDPSSPFTGGALLGDRVRMTDIANRQGIFVRSMASRGTLGGLAQATSAVIKVLDAAGYDVILVETVGAGQAEVDIATVAHTVIVVEAPGSGDEIQSIKAGILEIADILVVNKADRPSALNTVRALEMMIHLGQPTSMHHGRRMAAALSTDAPEPAVTEQWQVPVMQTIAVKRKGVGELLEQVEAHRRYLHDSGEWYRREKKRSRREIERLLQARILSRLRRVLPPDQREKLISAVARREIDPYTAAESLYDLAYQKD